MMPPERVLVCPHCKDEVVLQLGPNNTFGSDVAAAKCACEKSWAFFGYDDMVDNGLSPHAMGDGAIYYKKREE